MNSTEGNIEIQQQYKQEFAVKKNKKEAPLFDLTRKQWFWDMAVMS